MAIVLSGAFAKARALEVHSLKFFYSSAFVASAIWAKKEALLTFVWVADGGGAG